MKDRRINDRYQIIRPVGGGGMADVYLARDLILDRQVAVKMLKSQFSNDEEFIRRFRREAQSATSLSHPNVVNIYDVGEEEDLYYIVMEYVDGQTLKDYIQENGKLTVQETVRILEQMTSAVSHAHDNQIVHRDLKPHNILIGYDGVAKVTDFGIARAISEATITHTNSVLGSVHYLSPEQARGGQVTFKSDLYSLGIVAFEMLTGEVPFQGDTAVSVAIKQLQEPLPLLREKDDSIPQSMENLVMKATAKDPDDRYLSVRDMSSDLSTVLNLDRMNEAAKYLPTNDEEVTRAVPIIGGNQEKDRLDQTMVHPQSNSRETNTFAKMDKAENNTDEKSKKKKGFKFWFKLSILALLFLIGLFVVSFYLIPSWLHVNEVEIPEGIVGMEYEEAFQTLTELNLEVEQEPRFDDEMEEGRVISLNPREGASVKEGTLIRLFVSEGMEPVEMSDLTGETREQAEILLEDFESVEVQFEETTEYGDDIVINQSPTPRDMVIPNETVVTLTVSERPTYIMSNLYGMSRQEVLNATSDNSLLNLNFEDDYHPTVEEGNVISQDPARGTEIRERTDVTVVFSRGPEPEEEPEEENLEEEEPEEEQEPISATVPFSVEVNETEENGEPRTYRIRISVTDMDNRTPHQVIDEEITETTSFDIPMTVAPDDSGFLILNVDDEEFEDSPYEYTYEELQQYE